MSEDAFDIAAVLEALTHDIAKYRALVTKWRPVVEAAERLIADYRSDSPDGGASTYALCKAVDAMKEQGE